MEDRIYRSYNDNEKLYKEVNYIDGNTNGITKKNN
jgi:hypothetical protein